MKKIKVAFTVFWQGFDINNNYFVNILRDKYIVDIITDTRWEETEYLFYSCFGYEHLKYDCIKIYYTGENLVPDFNLCDYAIGYEHLQYGDRYIRMPLYVIEYREDFQHMLDIRDSIVTRNKFCSFVASNNAEADSTRKDIFTKLSKYKQVDAGGRYLNNIGCPGGVVDKQAFQEQYKFSLAIENSSHPGYCTEKIIQAFAAGTIPIYWGDPLVADYFNENAFINCHRYRNLDEVVEVVKCIDQDTVRYQTMLKEKIITDSQQSMQAYDNRFQRWLQNIIEQPLEQAYRRSIYGKEMVYKNQLKRWIRCEEEYVKYSQRPFIKRLITLIYNK